MTYRREFYFNNPKPPRRPRVYVAGITPPVVVVADGIYFGRRYFGARFFGVRYFA